MRKSLKRNTCIVYADGNKEVKSLGYMKYIILTPKYYKTNFSSKIFDLFCLKIKNRKTRRIVTNEIFISD